MKYRRVLLVEDEPLLNQIITRNLAIRGHVVTSVATGAEAVQAALAESPDLLLLDLYLPDRSGWDVLRELKARGMSVPVAIISAVRPVPRRLQEFHPLAYLPKPFPIEALLRVVRGESPPFSRHRAENR